MARYILLILFVVMLGSRALGLDLSLAPGISVKNALLYVVFAMLIVESALAQNRKAEMMSVFIPFGLLLMYALMTWIVIVTLLDYPHYSPRETLITLKSKLADKFLMCAVFFYGVTTARDARWLLRGLTWAMIVGSFVTVLDTWDIPDMGIITQREDGRVEGIVGGSNEYGALLAFFLPATVALYSTETGVTRKIAMLGIAVTVVALFMSASRGALVGVAAGGALAAIYLRRYLDGPAIGRAIIVSLGLCVIAVVTLILTDFWYLLEERLFTGVGTGSAVELTSGRSSIWLQALRKMTQSPVAFFTGFGWDAYYQTAGRNYSTHNAYLGYLYNLGVIGLAAFLVTYLNCLSAARRGVAAASGQDRSFLLALVFGLLAFMITMMFSDLDLPGLFIWAYIGTSLRLAVTIDRNPVSEYARPKR